MKFLLTVTALVAMATLLAAPLIATPDKPGDRVEARAEKPQQDAEESGQTADAKSGDDAKSEDGERVAEQAEPSKDDAKLVREAAVEDVETDDVAADAVARRAADIDNAQNRTDGVDEKENKVTETANSDRVEPVDENVAEPEITVVWEPASDQATTDQTSTDDASDETRPVNVAVESDQARPAQTQTDVVAAVDSQEAAEPAPARKARDVPPEPRRKPRDLNVPSRQMANAEPPEYARRDDSHSDDGFWDGGDSDFDQRFARAVESQRNRRYGRSERVYGGDRVDPIIPPGRLIGRLRANGYEEPHRLRCQRDTCRVRAFKYGQLYRIEVDAYNGQVLGKRPL